MNIVLNNNVGLFVKNEIVKAAEKKGYSSDKYEVGADSMGVVWAVNYTSNRRTKIGIVNGGEIKITKPLKEKPKRYLGKHPISFYVDDELYASLQRKAVEKSISVSELMRDTVKSLL